MCRNTLTNERPRVFHDESFDDERASEVNSLSGYQIFTAQKKNKKQPDRLTYVLVKEWKIVASSVKMHEK